MDCHALLQGIFPTQGWKPGLPHCRWILYRLTCIERNPCLSKPRSPITGCPQPRPSLLDCSGHSSRGNRPCQTHSGVCMSRPVWYGSCPSPVPCNSRRKPEWSSFSRLRAEVCVGECCEVREPQLGTFLVLRLLRSLQRQWEEGTSHHCVLGLPWWLSGKESTCNARATGGMSSIPGSGRSPGGGHGNPLQYSCLKNPMDRGAWQATVHGVPKSQTRLSDCACTHCILMGSLWTAVYPYFFHNCPPS